jgi:hypothetical protein
MLDNLSAVLLEHGNGSGDPMRDLKAIDIDRLPAELAYSAVPLVYR